jgi:hypothetical protein
VTPRLVAAFALVASAAMAVVLVGTGLGWWNDGTTASPARALAVRTSLAPAQSLFGDTLLADVDVDVDTDAVSPSRIRVVPNFTPYAETGAPVVSTSRSGRSATVRFRYRIQCVSQGCVPATKPPTLRFAPVVVRAGGGGRTRTVRAAWPPALVASRLSSADLQRVRFHRPLTLPPATSRSALPDLLTAAAGALALLAVALVAVEAVRLYDRRRVRAQPTPLERALRLTRDSARRSSAADRRKALSLLSQTLEDEGASGLAGTASVVAWSDSPPSPETVLRVADDVETAGSDPR